MIFLAVWGKRLLFVPPVVLAIGALIYMTQTRQPPNVKTETARALPTDLIEAFGIDLFESAVKIEANPARIVDRVQ